MFGLIMDHVGIMFQAEREHVGCNFGELRGFVGRMSILLKIVMSIRSKVAQGRGDFYNESCLLLLCATVVIAATLAPWACYLLLDTLARIISFPAEVSDGRADTIIMWFANLKMVI
jgi:hypothetical protein